MWFCDVLAQRKADAKLVKDISKRSINDID